MAMRAMARISILPALILAGCATNEGGGVRIIEASVPVPIVYKAPKELAAPVTHALPGWVRRDDDRAAICMSADDFKVHKSQQEELNKRIRACQELAK